jgi:hypothetical protein
MLRLNGKYHPFVKRLHRPNTEPLCSSTCLDKAGTRYLSTDPVVSELPRSPRSISQPYLMLNPPLTILENANGFNLWFNSSEIGNTADLPSLNEYYWYDPSLSFHGALVS